MSPSGSDDFTVFPEVELPFEDHDHVLEGASHDERCLPPRVGLGTRTFASDLYFPSFLCSGPGTTSHQHASYEWHNESCLDGCLSLGLAPAVNNRMAVPLLYPWDAFTSIPSVHRVPTSDSHMRGTPTTTHPGHLGPEDALEQFMDADAMSLGSRDSPSQSPEDPHNRILRDSPVGDVASDQESEYDWCDDSHCCHGPCSPEICGKLIATTSWYLPRDILLQTCRTPRRCRQPGRWPGLCRLV